MAQVPQPLESRAHPPFELVDTPPGPPRFRDALEPVDLLRRGRAWELVFFLASGAAILCKESSVLLLAFFAPWLAVEGGLLRRSFDMRAAVGSLAAVGAAVLACWLWIADGPERLVRLVEIIVSSPDSNPYALSYQSGSVTRYLFDFFLVSPGVLVLGLAAMALRVLGRRPASPQDLFLAGFFAAVYAAFTCFAKNLRYVLVLDFPLRVFAVLAISGLAKRAVPSPRGRDSAVALTILVFAACDLFLFKRLFLDGRIYDPVTADLLEAWQDLLFAG